jgi:hypothetical protein
MALLKFSMKKRFMPLLMLLGMLSTFLGSIPSQALASSLDSGDLIKSSSYSTVYYYGADGKRYNFPNEKTYFSWYTDFDDVEIVSDSTLASLTLAGNITYRPGTRMVKLTTDPKVYAIERGGVLRWVQSESIASSIYGSSWNSQIDDIPDTFFPYYHIMSEDPIISSDDYDEDSQYAFSTTINIDKELSAGSFSVPNTPVLVDPGSTVGSGVTFTITWPDISNADRYILYTADNAAFTGKSKVAGGTSHSFSDYYTPSTDTTYYYKAIACNAAGCSDNSNSVDIKVSHSSGYYTPTLIDPGSSVDAGDVFTLDWNTVSSDSEYKLQYDTDATFESPTTVYEGTTSSYSTSFSPSSATTYYWRVRSENMYGSGVSRWSSIVDMTVGAASSSSTTTPGTTTLSDPGSSVTSGSSVTISWTESSDATSYELQYATDSTFSSPTTLYSGSSRSLLTTPTPSTETTYYYRVRGVNSHGNGTWSNTVDLTVTISSSSTTTPGTTTLSDPGSSIESGTSVTISWTASSDASSYELQYATNSSFTSSATLYSGSSRSTLITPTSSIATTYYYRVRGVNSHGNGTWSNTVDLSITVAGMTYDFVDNVSDADQPPTNTLGLSNIQNWSTPIAAANILDYWDNEWEEIYTIDVNAELTVAQAANYIGWFMNTNNLGSNDRDDGEKADGTLISNITNGLSNWVMWEGDEGTDLGFDDGGIGNVSYKHSYLNWDIETIDEWSSNVTTAWSTLKSEVVANRPAIMTFMYWNPVSTGTVENGITFYSWGNAISNTEGATLEDTEIWEDWYEDYIGGGAEYSDGHSVTAIGYVEDYDAGDGDGEQDWVIFHDSWDTIAGTGAIPLDKWMALTTIYPQE